MTAPSACRATLPVSMTSGVPFQSSSFRKILNISFMSLSSSCRAGRVPEKLEPVTNSHPARASDDIVGVWRSTLGPRRYRLGPPSHLVRARAWFLASCLGAVVTRDPEKSKQEIACHARQRTAAAGRAAPRTPHLKDRPAALQQPTGLMYFPEGDMPSGEDQDAQSALYTRTRHRP